MVKRMLSVAPLKGFHPFQRGKLLKNRVLVANSLVHAAKVNGQEFMESPVRGNALTYAQLTMCVHVSLLFSPLFLTWLEGRRGKKRRLLSTVTAAEMTYAC